MALTLGPCALITGGGKRIGSALATAIAARGWSVAIHYGSSRSDAESLAERCRAAGAPQAIAIHCDLADAAGVAGLVPRVAAALAPPTLLVNNASRFAFDDLGSLSALEWDLHQAVNVRAPVLLAQAMAATLPDTVCNGLIVNIIDQRVWAPTPLFFSYTASKLALWAATRMLAQALAPRIRVNAIGPGPTLQGAHQSAADFAAEAAATPLGRATTTQEIAAALCFILDAPAMTGQMIALDGGQHLRWLHESTPAPAGQTSVRLGNA